MYKILLIIIKFYFFGDIIIKSALNLNLIITFNLTGIL